MSKVTIVSCYYPLNKSKHRINEYIEWFTNFLSHVDTPIVIFGEGEVLKKMQQIRESAGLGHKFLAISKPFSELHYSTPSWIEVWEKQVQKSNYKELHNQELFRIWANKSHFVGEAIEKNPFASEVFVWCDAGCWRDPFVAQLCGPSWPLPEKIEPNRLHIIAMSDVQPWREKVDALPADIPHAELVSKIPTHFSAIVGGTILLGDKAAWQTWIPTFDETLNLFIQTDLFAGDDQAVLASTSLWLRKHDPSKEPVFLRAPPRSNFLTMAGRPFGDAWFAFQIHFSQIGFSLNSC